MGYISGTLGQPTAKVEGQPAGPALYGSKWRRERAKFLEEFPLCEDHEKRGRTVAAAIVDHRVPHKGDLKLFWRRSNWQSLCKQCHDGHKQRIESGSTRLGCDTNGLPLSAAHHWNRPLRGG